MASRAVSRAGRLAAVLSAGARRPGRRGAGDAEQEAGAILILWAVALTALLAFLAGAINLGNLLQSSSNVQDAADAAAIAAMTALHNGSPEVGTAAETIADDYFSTNPSWGDTSVCDPLASNAGVPAWTTASTTDCVRYDAARNVVWVGIPPQTVRSLFGSSSSWSLARSAFAMYPSSGPGGPKLCHYPGNCPA